MSVRSPVTGHVYNLTFRRNTGARDINFDISTMQMVSKSVTLLRSSKARVQINTTS